MSDWADWGGDKLWMGKWAVLLVGASATILNFCMRDPEAMTPAASSASGGSKSVASKEDLASERPSQLRDLLATNAMVLQNLYESQKAMREEMADQRTAQRSSELLEAARREAMGEMMGSSVEQVNSQKAIQEMAQRLQSFEGLLRDHSGMSPKEDSAEMNAMLQMLNF